MRAVVYQDAKGRFRSRIKNKGRVVSDSGQSYTNAIDCEREAKEILLIDELEEIQDYATLATQNKDRPNAQSANLKGLLRLLTKIRKNRTVTRSL